VSNYLIVGNRTLPSELLARAIEERLPGATRFYVVVPLTPIVHALTWEEGESIRAAETRLNEFLADLRSRGAVADGEVGDNDPVLAMQDVLRRMTADEILLSTLPPGRSRWLGMDVPSRLRAATRIPVTVLTDTSAAVAAQPERLAPSPAGPDQASSP
jgi:hypothetical protein